MDRDNRGADEQVLLWVTSSGDADHRPLAGVARELGLELRTCTLADGAETLRGDADIVGFELDGDRGRALAQMRRVRDRLPGTSVFAATAEMSVAGIREALAAGASELLALPLQRAEASKVLVKLTQLRGEAATPRAAGSIVVVHGARGGLGATTLAVNLAVRLRTQTQREVVLVDLDLQRGDVAAFLNLTPLQSWATIAAAENEVDAAFVQSVLTRHPSGVHVLPAPMRIEEAETVSHEQAALALALLRGQFAFTVVDTSRTLTAATVAGLEAADRTLLVTDLSVPGVRAAQRLVDLLRQLGAVRPDLVIAERPGSPVPAKDAARTIGIDPLMLVPRDDATAGEAMNTGAPLNGRNSSLTLAVTDLAARIAGGNAGDTPRRSLLRRIFT